MEKKSNIKLFERIKYVKNIEIYFVVIIGLVLLITYFSFDFGVGNTNAAQNEEEKRLCQVLSKIKGAGEVSLIITRNDENEVVGVVVVADGGKDVGTKVRLISATARALNVDSTKVEVFERK